MLSKKNLFLLIILVIFWKLINIKCHVIIQIVKHLLFCNKYREVYEFNGFKYKLKIINVIIAIMIII